MMNKSSNRIVILVFTSLIFLISSLFLLRNIYDPDFFWHIKTGEWIWQHKALPSEDPFAYTSPGHHTTREHFILTSFWLSQVIYYLSYLAGGLSGIVVLRFFMVGSLVYAVWKRKHGDNIIHLGLTLVFLIFFLKQFPIERPQVFSFLFFAVLLYLLEKVKNETSCRDVVCHAPAEDKSIYFLTPLLMLVWANMHPGFIVGQATMVLYIIMEGVKFLHQSFRPIEIKAYKRLCLAAALGITFSLVNPNTYHVWRQYWQYNTSVEHWNLSAAYIASLNPDYMSSIQYFLWSNDYTVMLYWLLMFLAIAGQVVNWGKTDITEVSLLTATGFASFITARYGFFFIAAALPVVARHFSSGRIVKFGRLVMPAIALFAGIYFAWGDRNNLESLRSGVKVDNYLCPVKAADFIISADVRGNMYNVYEWGGYLIWRLSPERKVFTDPRDLFEDVGRDSRFMSSANAHETSGMPTWKAIASTRRLEYMVIPIAYPTGTVVPLFFALIQDEDWLPVFCDINSVIFVKNSLVNKHVIMKYSIPKDYLMNGLIGLYERLTDMNPGETSLHITEGDLYLGQGRVAKAIEVYEKAVELAPLNVTAHERLNLVKGGGNH